MRISTRDLNVNLYVMLSLLDFHLEREWVSKEVERHMGSSNNVIIKKYVSMTAKNSLTLQLLNAVKMALIKNNIFIVGFICMVSVLTNQITSVQ